MSLRARWPQASRWGERKAWRKSAARRNKPKGPPPENESLPRVIERHNQAPIEAAGYCHLAKRKRRMGSRLLAPLLRRHGRNARSKIFLLEVDGRFDADAV